jgi:hypothetical protein
MLARSVGLAFLICLGACSDSTPTKKTQVVGTTGGALALSDGSGVNVPSGAVGTDTTFTIVQSNSSPAPTGATPVAKVYNFGPEGATFTKPVVVTIPIDSSKLPAGKTAADVRIYTAPAGSGNYTVLATTVVDDSHVSAPTTHFSDFTAAVTSGPSDTIPPDMAVSSPADMAMAKASSSDMTSGNCQPTCTSMNNMCGCTATCGTKMYGISCTQTATAGPAHCYCIVDGQPQTSPAVPPIDICSKTLVQTTFLSKCLPN